MGEGLAGAAIRVLDGRAHLIADRLDRIQDRSGNLPGSRHCTGHAGG